MEACVIFMALSIAFRIIGCWGLWNERSYAILQIALPIASALLLILCVTLLGKKALWLSFIPVTLGAVFFIVKATDFPNKLQMVLCILLYITVIALYFCTVFGIFKTKWFLIPLFGLPFLYHVFVEDLKALQDTANPVTFAAGMQEMGVLCIMLGLFFLSLSMKKQVTETEEELPKIRTPKVVAPVQPSAENEDVPPAEQISAADEPAPSEIEAEPEKEESEHSEE